MKNLLLPLVLLVGSLSTQAQTAIIEYTYLKGGSWGMEFAKPNRKGFYISAGSNLMALTFEPHLVKSDYDVDFFSAVSSYSQYGPLLPTYPNEPIWTDPDWGNVVVDEGAYRKVTTWTDQYRRSFHRWLNVGLVFPMDKLKLRVGGGIWIENVTGRDDYRQIIQSGYVTEYWDSWEIAGNSQNRFIVETNTRIKDTEKTTPIQYRTIRFNPNISLVFNHFENESGSIDFSIGLNAKSLVVGMNLNL
jgi:hypothetical protein